MPRDVARRLRVLADARLLCVVVPARPERLAVATASPSWSTMIGFHLSGPIPSRAKYTVLSAERLCSGQPTWP